MKKILLTACALAALSSAETSATIKEGFNVSLMPGLALNYAGLRGDFRDYWDSVKLRNRAGFNLGAAFGYTWSLKDKYFLGARLVGGYNFSNVTLGRDNDGDNVRFRPRWNYGLGMTFGGCLSQTLKGYLGVNLTRDQSQIRSLSDGDTLRDNFTVYSVTPLIGLTGMINESLSWNSEIGYKIGFKTSGLRKFSAEAGRNFTRYIKKPRAFLASVGVTYHF